MSQHYTPTVHVGANEVCHVRATEASGTDLTITPDGGSSGTTLTADGTGLLPGFTYSGSGVIYVKTSTGLHPQTPDKANVLTGNYKHLAATAAIQMLKTGPGVLRGVFINTKIASAVLTVDDVATTGGSGAGTHMAVIDCSGATGFLPFNAKFKLGLAVTLAGGNADVTLVWD